MTYYDGMILPLPQANEGAYRKHASDAAPLFQELGVTRIVENLGNDVPDILWDPTITKLLNTVFKTDYEENR